MEDLVESVEEAEPHPQAPLFSLVSGEGDGAMLGLAAGDTAGGAWELGYSAVTAQAAVIAYELIEHRRIDAEALRSAVLELDGSPDEEPVYRAESPAFRLWLDRAARGDHEPGTAPGTDGLARAVVVGVAFRRDPDGLIRETIAMTHVFQRDPATVAAGLVAASAAAAMCFGQAGKDLIAGVAEAVIPALGKLDGGAEQTGQLGRLESELKRLADHVGVIDGEEALRISGGDAADPLHAVQAGLLLAAPSTERAHIPIEQAARIGGSNLAAFVGAIIGARVGIRAWPWPFANDTWFAEIGRRLVRGPYTLDGLPIPYAVEQHLTYGSRPDFH